MSTSSAVYIGPYAMWVDAPFPRDPETDDTMFVDVLEGHWGSDSVTEIEVGKRANRVWCFAPHHEYPRRNGPKHAVTYYGAPGGCAALDFADVDVKAEMKAFQRAYKTELDAMAERIGKPPIIRWGVVYSES